MNFAYSKRMALIWTLVDQDFLTTDFHSSKSCLFLVSTSSSFLEFCRTKEQLGTKMAIFKPQQEGSNLDQIQKYFIYDIYWDQYQGLRTPMFWLNVLFQKAAPP
jgi:hypothetical protein